MEYSIPQNWRRKDSVALIIKMALWCSILKNINRAIVFLFLQFLVFPSSPLTMKLGHEAEFFSPREKGSQNKPVRIESCSWIWGPKQFWKPLLLIEREKLSVGRKTLEEWVRKKQKHTDRFGNPSTEMGPPVKLGICFLFFVFIMLC